MELSAEIVRGILERRLAPAAIEQLLAELPEAGKAQLLLRIAAVARRNAALVDVANRVSDTLSLDVLFVRLLEAVTEFLYQILFFRGRSFASLTSNSSRQ